MATTVLNDLSNFVGLNGGYTPNQSIYIGNGAYTAANPNGFVEMTRWNPETGETENFLLNQPQFEEANPASYGVPITNGAAGANASQGFLSQTNDFVNNTFGGWGNLFQGLQGLSNLYFGFQNLGLAKDQLALQRDAFNFNKGITTRNLANQIQAYNTSLEDRYRARAYTETGNADAYNDKIEKNKLDSKI